MAEGISTEQMRVLQQLTSKCWRPIPVSHASTRRALVRRGLIHVARFDLATPEKAPGTPPGLSYIWMARIPKTFLGHTGGCGYAHIYG